MDIQIETTPPKRVRNPYTTPPHSSTHLKGTPEAPKINFTPCQTPPRRQNVYETPRKTPMRQQEGCSANLFEASGLKPKENPESKKAKRSPFPLKGSASRYSPCPQFEISPFTLSRLEQDYCLEHYLGKGHFSSVGLFRSRLTGEMFAIKTAKANRMSVNQVQALGSLWVMTGQCPNVVRYYHSWIEDGELFLVMEYCQGSLQKIIAEHRVSGSHFPEKTIIGYLRSALLGLASVHKHGILHLDIKPENILFKGSTLKIADFGLSRAAQLRNGDIEQGDSRYLAKEVLNIQSGLDLTKADIYSLAVTAYEMLTLQVLSNNGEEWLKMRDEGIKIQGRMDLTSYSDQLLSVVQKMGAADWRHRPSAAELLQHPLFKQSAKIGMMSNSKSNRKRQSSL